MKDANEIREQLAYCTGTVNYYRTGLSRRVVYTDGVKQMADLCGAYWLIDAITSHQPNAMRNEMLRDFQVWTLTVEDNSAELFCTDGNEPEAIIKQKIEFTDFPLDEIKFYVAPASADCWVILLTSEY